MHTLDRPLCACGRPCERHRKGFRPQCAACRKRARTGAQPRNIIPICEMEARFTRPPEAELRDTGARILDELGIMVMPGGQEVDAPAAGRGYWLEEDSEHPGVLRVFVRVPPERV